jgi:uncharacterized protein (TIGR00299 family) protein
VRPKSRAKPGTRNAEPRPRRQRAATPGARILHLDCFSGIAGNMCVAALLDLGLPLQQLEADLAGLALPHRLIVRRVRRGALAARYLDVQVPGAGAARPGRRRRPNAHAHDQPHDHEPEHTHPHADGRHYAEIVRVLEAAKLAPDVKARALGIFEALARAEASVHGIPIGRVHFHEVGAVDAIVDVTGVAIGLSRLGIARVSASPVALGGGRVQTAHGALPLPAPATLELLRGIPTVPAHVQWETVTPTGAAILRSVVDEFCELPAMTIEAIGHGAGRERPGGLPNVLRAVLGRESGFVADRVVCLETNLDDLVPEHFDHLMERLFAAGALDVSLQHLQMKKNRPGILVRVIGRPSDRMALARVLFAESTAIGVRTSECERIVLEREELRVRTRFGAIRVKRVFDPDGRPLVSAEVDDCRRAAVRAGAPLRDVVRAAEEAARARA